MPPLRTERVFPLYATLSKAPPVESTRPFVALAALGPNARLNEPRNSGGSFGSMTSCESEPMCSIEEAANACVTRAPILAKSTRVITLHHESTTRFPVLRRISSEPNMIVLSA